MDPGKLLFFDIETHRVLEWNELSSAIKTAFINHYYDSATYENPEDHYKEIAGLHAEFSRVICISFGYEAIDGSFIKQSLYGIDEIKILESARKLFNTFIDNGYKLAGHNIISCDIPYLVKRYIINKLPVPPSINTYGLKPWEIEVLDSIDLWKFGDYKRVSLEMICASMGIPCKTDEIGGDNLYTYNINDIPWSQLVHYCEEDVESNYRFVKQTFSLLP